jgi:hypothetical protein
MFLLEYFKYGFSVSAHRAFVKTTMHGITECLIYYHGTPYSITSKKEGNFTAKEVCQEAYVISLVFP